MIAGKIALWMYRNEGGNKVQHALKLKLEEKGHQVINDFDMRECYYLDGNIYTKSGINLSKVDVLYHMNADEQNEHQNEILQALELSSVTVVNCWKGFSRAKDKFITSLLLKKHGICVPPSALIPKQMTLALAKRLFDEWGQVLFKPRSNHGGKGIVRFQDPSHFMDFVETMNPYITNYYLEKYIDFDKHDYRVEIVKSNIIGGYSRSKTHPFKTNIACGGLMTPITPPIECQKIALKATEIIGIDASIVDMVKSKQDNNFYVLEVNHSIGIFVEAGMLSGEKSIITEIDPVFANDNLKLNAISEYLDRLIQEKAAYAA